MNRRSFFATLAALLAGRLAPSAKPKHPRRAFFTPCIRSNIRWMEPPLLPNYVLNEAKIWSKLQQSAASDGASRSGATPGG